MFLPAALIFLLLMTPAPCWAKAQAITELKPSATELLYTQDTLKDKLKSLNDRQGIEEAIKSRMVKHYESAISNLGLIDAFNQRTAAFKRSIKEAPVETKRLQNEISQFQSQNAQPTPEHFSRISTEELEQRLILEKAKMRSLDDPLKKIVNELALQNNRPASIRSEMVAAQQEIDNGQKKLSALAASASTQLELEAEQIYLKTMMDARIAELNSLEIEAISNPARVGLLKTQSLWLGMQKENNIFLVSNIESLLAERRKQEAKETQSALNQAEKELAGKPAVIQALTRENIQYSRELQEITDKIENLLSQKATLDLKAEEIENNFKGAEKKIDLAGLSPALGKILRQQRRQLSLDSQWPTLVDTIQNETALASLSQFKVEERLDKLVDIDAALKEIMASQVPENLPYIQRMIIQAEARLLLNNQKDLLIKLESADKTYLRSLGDFDFAREKMVAKAKQFADYLDKNLLWVPSSNPINLDFPLELAKSIRVLITPANWISLGTDSGNAMAKRPLASLLIILAFITCIVGRGRCKKQIEDLSENVGKLYTDRFIYTLSAFPLTLILVLPIPILGYGWGWLLSNHYQGGDFSKAIGVGLQSASVALLLLEFFFRLFSAKGIARIHFQWQKDSVLLLCNQITWLRFVVIPAIFLIGITGASTVIAYSDSLGRLALIVALIGMAVLLHRLLNPNGCLMKPFLLEHPNSTLNKFRFLWYPVAFLSPLVVIGFAATGYYLSALELQQKLGASLGLIFLVVVLHQLVLRWLNLVNRQIALENIRQKRKAAMQSDKHSAPPGSEEPMLPIEEQLIDIPKINAQTMKLVNMLISITIIIGFWLIWGNILPAFSFLDHIALWQHEVTIDKQPTMQPITLTNLLLALLYGFVTIVSVINFSGLMELLLFGRMGMEPGSRYAINQMAKYVMVSIGIITIANELGGSWSKVQWLVAALSVGLGFGLQEIFANLVSGIILLFERPIRVGDTVTIGAVTGKVSRIQMRATTIIDWDQKELVVPNKTFITSELVNWTLSDAITRVVIPVGIAYGSDVEKAHRVMMETVLSTPLVLKDPEPCVLFMEFGDSSLHFSVRVFVSETGHRLPVIHDLHVRLEKALRENHINIPLPQRELHIRSAVTVPLSVETMDWQNASAIR